MEQRDSRIYEPEDLNKIKFSHEREVAVFLREINPDYNLHYERREYSISESESNRLKQKKKATLPDFEWEDPQSGELVAIFEVTESRSDSKNRQRRIMASALPEVPYIVLDRFDVNLIKRRNEQRHGVIFEKSDNLYKIQRYIRTIHSAAD